MDGNCTIETIPSDSKREDSILYNVWKISSRLRISIDMWSKEAIKQSVKFSHFQFSSPGLTIVQLEYFALAFKFSELNAKLFSNQDNQKQCWNFYLVETFYEYVVLEEMTKNDMHISFTNILTPISMRVLSLNISECYLDRGLSGYMWHEEVESEILAVHVLVHFISDCLRHHVTVQVCIILQEKWYFF